MRALAAAFALAMLAAPAAASPVLLISLDGLRPGDIAEAKARGLKLPALTALRDEGAAARGVIGVLPTLTYPSHTTLVTGVAPARHGVVNNLTFDPEQKNQSGWYWYAADVRVPTLWQAAHAAGLRTANVHWPVSVGAAGIDANLPQIWRTGTDDDAKLLTALATPGLVARLERQVGRRYPQGIDETVEGDAGRVAFAEALLAEKPQFMTVYLAGIDHAEHQAGPGSLVAKAAIEASDALVGRLVRAARAAMPDVTVVVISDHGFLPIDTDINLFRPFIDAGLITLDAKSQVAGWDAMPWLAGGTAAIRLARPDDPALIAKVRGVLATMAADPAYRIARILDRSEIAKAGGGDAGFVVALKPGSETGRDPAAPIARPSVYKGMHGYVPWEPAMRSTLIVAGPGIPRHGDLGVVDMRGIAPAIARRLGATLAGAEAPPAF
ncbi:putative AlkP superfamily pyrophosphatase or phosphodiesterase [Sphingomonas jinjuensis]|uniref:Putative AlkP superfamily pyrophosphatase or phosphodiesterase n=1 Tax=Sphingomonas jinjuensis TaxID=535907 RepID=A0A840FBC0_9SPHN|nr:ectonucleotide pyrophosphatase/phosphodiesterase [Sphingomonas jinjuensis]MBB4153074.1 putative AlkP superfamily pyrophosphatase or phosphodiesterase [Sphingomonas jinjuensis]